MVVSAVWILLLRNGRVRSSHVIASAISQSSLVTQMCVFRYETWHIQYDTGSDRGPGQQQSSTVLDRRDQFAIEKKNGVQ